MGFSLKMYLCLSLSVNLSVCASIYYLYVCLSIYIVCLSVGLFTVCLSVGLFTICTSVCPQVWEILGGHSKDCSRMEWAEGLRTTAEEVVDKAGAPSEGRYPSLSLSLSLSLGVVYLFLISISLSSWIVLFCPPLNLALIVVPCLHFFSFAGFPTYLTWTVPRTARWVL